jgi:hypothetical protein
VQLHPVAQPVGQHRQLRLDEVVLGRGREVQAVGVALELLGRHPDELGVAVPQREHAGAGQEVDEDVAVDVAHEAAGGLGRRERQVTR